MNERTPETQSEFPKTKIVCTLGPSTESTEMLEKLIVNGMSIARLNFSHGDLRTHSMTAQRVRMISEQLGIAVGIMVDVPGPKYRTGVTCPSEITLSKGERITLTSEAITGAPKQIPVSPPGIHRDATVGHAILLDDGLIKLNVLKISEGNVECEVLIGGKVTDRRGVTTPGKAPSQPFPDAKAEEALKFATDIDADFVALSTVTSPDDIEKAREYMRAYSPRSYIVSKIERAEALNNLDDIIRASDAIMVARGDLGVEVPISRVPIIQKDLIDRCNNVGKPVITATQMLESMIHSQTPTRAEVTDVANAIFDGTDAIMLSAETSVGDYPIEAVSIMAETARQAEEALPYQEIIMKNRTKVGHNFKTNVIQDAISYDAVRSALQLESKVIVAFTESGQAPGRISRYRPRTKILALTPHERIRRQLTIRWGVTTVLVQEIKNVDEFFEIGYKYARQINTISKGDTIILVAGVPIGVSGSTNLLRVLTT